MDDYFDADDADDGYHIDAYVDADDIDVPGIAVGARQIIGPPTGTVAIARWALDQVRRQRQLEECPTCHTAQSPHYRIEPDELYDIDDAVVAVLGEARVLLSVVDDTTVLYSVHADTIIDCGLTQAPSGMSASGYLRYIADVGEVTYGDDGMVATSVAIFGEVLAEACMQ